MHRARHVPLLTIGMVAALAAPAGAQLLSLGLRGGASVATMSLPEGGSPGGRTGILMGPTATLWLSDALAFQFDARYVGKGFTADAATGVTTALSISYMEVPLVAVVSLPRAGTGTFQARLQAGGAIGLRVRCRVAQGPGDVTGISDCNPDNVGTFDFGLVGGLGLKVGRGRGGFTLDATYTLGLLDANLNADLTARNRTLQIGVGFLFPII